MGILLGILAIATGAWTWLALSVHSSWKWRILLQVDAAIAALGLLGGLFAGFTGPVAAILGLWIAACAIWYLTRIPRNDKAWIPEVLYGATGHMGRNITLPHVRRFRWISRKEVIEAWEPWEVDPEAITSVDLIMSVWSSPLIAHTMVSFGFADGRHLVFSGETRRQKGDKFTITGGFFRRFELILIAADERDVIHLRTDVRREKVSLFPVLMEPVAMRALFLAFISQGNDLAKRAMWYNTVTTNCTTVPFEIVQTIAPRLRYDWRLLFSGHLPGYLKKLGVLPPGTMAELQARAVLPVSGDDGTDDIAYSRRLRAAWRD